LEEIALPFFKPLGLSACLAIRAVPIAAGVVGDLLVTALVTFVLVPSKGRGLAAGEIP
jgi:hypothetical protein